MSKTPQRVSLSEALSVASLVCDTIKQHVIRTQVCGSVRRGKTDVGDVDIVARIKYDTSSAMVTKCLKFTGGNQKATGVINGVQVDVMFVYEDDAWGAALCHLTGPKGRNIAQRKAAIALGLRLNEYGLWDGAKRVAGKTEEGVYKALGLTYRQPEDR